MDAINDECSFLGSSVCSQASKGKWMLMKCDIDHHQGSSVIMSETSRERERRDSAFVLDM